jgi:phosphorylase/glycogen(starch) synthase
MEKDDFLFEISWEVCNKVGGIHTVISSKVSTIKKYVENYFVMGPYLNGNKAEFTEEELPESFRDVYDKLVSMGINIYYGSWKVNGSPKVILVDYMGFASNVNDIKSKLSELYGIDSLNSAWHDFDEVILWSWCCGIVISELSSSLGIDSDVYVHAHEWMSGGSIFYINSLNDKKFKSVFTTHATMLGRTLGGCGESVYEIGDDFDPDKKAYEYGVNTKHQCERALSRVAGAFTTVSEITSRETKRFYGREPDRLLYNGFDNYEEDFEENIESIFDYSRKKINDFLDLYFKQFYEIDFKKSKVFYTSGRNEFRNKGVDLYIKALGMLNKKLKEENCDYDVVNLFLIPVGDFEKDERLNEDLPSDMKSDLWDVAPLSSHKVPTDNEIVSSFLQEG